jgi:hypothetical protein
VRQLEQAQRLQERSSSGVPLGFVLTVGLVRAKKRNGAIQSRSSAKHRLFADSNVAVTLQAGMESLGRTLASRDADFFLHLRVRDPRRDIARVFFEVRLEHALGSLEIAGEPKRERGTSWIDTLGGSTRASDRGGSAHGLESASDRPRDGGARIGGHRRGRAGRRVRERAHRNEACARREGKEHARVKSASCHSKSKKFRGFAHEKSKSREIEKREIEKRDFRDFLSPFRVSPGRSARSCG